MYLFIYSITFSYFVIDSYRKAMENPDLFGGDMMGIADPNVS